ncbi:MAG: IS110 family transposase [Clostridiales bacterium]|nr:IS110 family transposase [Clostridiales bacterium]
MKVIYSTCCGIDVHKKFLIATVITSDSIKPKYYKKRFSTFNSSLKKLKNWLIEHQCYHICMESTGKYWIPVYNILESTCFITLANPKWVRAIQGQKDDIKDSKWIAELHRLGLVPGSFIPEKPIRILREFTRYEYKITNCKSSEKNRFQNALTVCNVALDSVVSDMFGVSATAITDYLISNDTFDPEYCTSLLKTTLKKKADLVLESIEGYTMEESQKYRMLLIKEHLNFTEELIKTIDLKLDVLVQPYESVISLLKTIPGVNRKSAIKIISEIGVDMIYFDNSKRLCSWAGLTPTNNQSAGKKKSVKISRAGVYLKPALVQIAHAAVKSKETPYYAVKYERIRKRRGKKRAIIAIARMILTAIYNMLLTGEQFNPSDLYKIDMPEKLKEKQKQKAIKNAMKLLIQEGLIPQLDSVPN